MVDLASSAVRTSQYAIRNTWTLSAVVSQDVSRIAYRALIHVPGEYSREVR
jgi:hypothetical protein